LPSPPGDCQRPRQQATANQRLKLTGPALAAFPSFNVFAGGPGSLAERSAAEGWNAWRPIVSEMSGPTSRGGGAAELRGRVVGLIRWLLWGRTPARRDPVSTDSTEPRTAYPLTVGKTAMVGVILVGACVGVSAAVTFRAPIPDGNATGEEVVVFLKQVYPDREVSPKTPIASPYGLHGAAVAVVFHLIRSGEPAVARRALDFAAEKQFGSAAPYVIGRLGSDDPELERAAQDFLRTIAGRDYGPDAASWRAWWRDPPLNRYGLSVGWTTLKIAVTGAIALFGLLLMLICWRSRPPVAAVGGAFLGIAYFLAFVHVTMRFSSQPHTCTFGSIHITYYSGPIGLEDARIGGAGFGLLAMASFVLVPLGLVLVYHVLVKDARGRDA
jgi:hypothetical protein